MGTVGAVGEAVGGRSEIEEWDRKCGGWISWRGVVEKLSRGVGARGNRCLGKVIAKILKNALSASTKSSRNFDIDKIKTAIEDAMEMPRKEQMHCPRALPGCSRKSTTGLFLNT